MAMIDEQAPLNFSIKHLILRPARKQSNLSLYAWEKMLLQNFLLQSHSATESSQFVG